MNRIQTSNKFFFSTSLCRLLFISALFLSICCSGFCIPGLCVTAQAQAVDFYYPKEKKSRFPRLPGEYEPQRALILSVSDWQPHHSPIFTQIVRETAGHVDLVVLFNDRAQLVRTIDWLKEAKLKADHVSFSQIPLDTVWLRDFAPMFAETESGPVLSVDYYYVGGQRPKDDKLAEQWANLSDAKLKEVPWTLQGGNLLVNGKSLGVTTSKIFKDNKITFPGGNRRYRNADFDSRKIVTDAFLKECNLKLLVVLEPLMFEATGHCDMFATFLADDTVVVASVDPRADRFNAGILDRNAERLGKIQIGDRPMKVHRIKIPPRRGTAWSAYTNVIIANDLVLMPVMDTDPAAMIEQAKQVYRDLLPDHEVKTIDMTSMKSLQGELHCLSASLPEFAPLPNNLISLERAQELLGK